MRNHANTAQQLPLYNLFYGRKNSVFSRPGVYVARVVAHKNGLSITENFNCLTPPPAPLSSGTEPQKIVRFSPNPTNGKLAFENINEANDVEVSDATGRLLYTNSIIGKYNVQIDLSEYPNGVYMIKTDKEDVPQKIILQK